MTSQRPASRRWIGGLSLALLSVTWLGCNEQRLPDPIAKSAPSKADLMAFHRQRALALDSLISATAADWDAVVTTATGIRYEVLDTPARGPVSELPKGTVLELHHNFGLLDGRTITSWQADGPLAFELGATDLPAGFHEIIGAAQLGDSLRALIPPSRAWGMTGLPPDIPQEAVITIAMRIDVYTQPR